MKREAGRPEFAPGLQPSPGRPPLPDGDDCGLVADYDGLGDCDEDDGVGDDDPR